MKSDILMICTGCFFFFTSFNLHTTSSLPVVASDIAGVYWIAGKEAKVKIFMATNGKYSGKTIWMKEPNNPDGSPKSDVNNPNDKLQSRERVGLVALKYFEFDEDDQRWENGSVYDPRNGKTYDGYLKFEEGSTDILRLRGYISGMTWLGRTSVWTRVRN
ncbi:MAG: hypothetical protein ACI9UJ_000984 [bacterium]|jgi:uncharacterized protein (DUF2147 family)